MSKPVRMDTEVFSLEEGQVVFRLPSKMSPESYEDFKDWLGLIARKAKRAVATKEALVPHD